MEDTQGNSNALQRRAESLLKKAYMLGVLTACDILLLFSFKGQIQSYASPQLEPLITEERAKNLFTRLLCQPTQKKELANAMTDAAKPEEKKEDEEEFEEEKEEDLDDAHEIEDDAEREKAFRSRYVQLHNQCVKVSVLAHPEEGADVFLLIATPAKKIFSFATPKLQPMVSTPIGQNMIKAFLNANHPVPQALSS